MSPKPVIEVENVGMVRGEDKRILEGIGWRLRQGDHCALLGANGSGKTSLLKVICGYEWPTEGTVRVLGNRFGEVVLADVRKQIGWVSSSIQARIPEDQSAAAVVLSGLEASIGIWREFGRAEIQRAERAMESMEVAEFADKTYGVLSQGERQRVLIARALVSRPRLLILDEPCAGLDPAAREHFLKDLTKFARRKNGPTIVFVTHHIEEIPAFVRRGLLLKDGRVLAQGPIERVCNSKNLGEALGCKCLVSRENQGQGRRFSLVLK